jgi:hypothetical protein
MPVFARYHDLANFGGLVEANQQMPSAQRCREPFEIFKREEHKPVWPVCLLETESSPRSGTVDDQRPGGVTPARA